MKTLHVHSNGQWVEVGGSGAADLSQYATIEYVDGKVPAAASVTEHDAELPQVSPGSTPLQILQAWAGYEPGLHLFKGGPQRNMVLLSKSSMTGTTNTPNGEKPTASESLTATVFINGTGSTYIRITTTTVDGVQANANSEIVATMGGQWAKMTSTKGDVAFGAPQVADLFSLTGGGPQDLTGYALKDDDTQVISAAVVRALRHEFNTNAALAWEDVGGTARPVYKSGSKTFPLAFTTEVGGGSVDLSAYAKLQDNQQALLSKTITAQAYGFGDNILPAVGLGYVDTGEGYGNRLVLNIGLENEFLVYKSDLEPLNALLPRIETLESKAAPVIDLAPYVTLATADTRYGRLEALDLLRNQVQTIFDSIYTRAEADFRYPLKADVYTQKQTDDRFMRITDAFSKADFDNQMALMLYSRKQIDDLLTAISPLGSPSINNPALADFKKSVLDEVKLMLVGGTKMPPPDIDWTWMVRMDGAKESVSTEIQARMIGGFIELKGTLSFGAGSGAWVPLRLPPQFPLAEIDANYPLAMRLVGSAVTYGYCSVSSKSRDISCSPGARSSEANFSGIRWKAAY
jgi:hypothetical protein